jgi:hypothetical protein
MTQLDRSAESVTMADHLMAVRRRRWWVVVFTILGAFAGILGLRASTSNQHVVAVAVEYKWLTDPTNPTPTETIKPSDEGKAAAARRNELVPELKNANLTVEGQDESHRVVFTAAAETQDAATNAAMKFAKAFTADRLVVLNKHLDDQIALEEGSLADLETRLNGAVARSTGQDAAATLEIIDRTRRVAFLKLARGPEPMIGAPEVVRSDTTQLPATSLALPVLGVLMGALVGATLAAAAGRLDRRLYDRNDLERTIEGVPVLAVAGHNGEVAAYLPAAGSLIGQFGTPGTVIGVFNAGPDTSSTEVANGLQQGLHLVAQGSNAVAPTVRPIMTSQTDASMGLVDARDLDGVVVLSQFGKTRDAQLVEAVSSLNLIGARVLGLVLAGVPVHQLEAARVSTRR